MTKKTNFLDDTILRLRREYSKDEVVSALSKQISEKDIEIGKLKSYVDELEYTIQLPKDKETTEVKNKKIREQHIVNREANIKARESRIYLKQKLKIEKLEKLLNRYKKANNELLSRLNN